jgi:hypothetical protein
LRNGGRALDLAQRVYNATKAPQHGALVALALAELNRCSEAADWQRRMIAAAQREGKTDFSVKLQSALKLYENTQCRPGNETVLRDLFLEKN